jgi:restriction system protein
VQAVYKNRSGWAHDRLKRAGYSPSPRRRVWQLTVAGVAFGRSHPPPLETAVAELRATTIRELLETLGRVSPKFFETIVLDVLHKLGYGTSRSDLARIGRSGDGGIDG